eukprot:m51a1_g12893 hypothetical protein (180) ;mRNA; f:1105-2949
MESPQWTREHTYTHSGLSIGVGTTLTGSCGERLVVVAIKKNKTDQEARRSGAYSDLDTKLADQNLVGVDPKLVRQWTQTDVIRLLRERRDNPNASGRAPPRTSVAEFLERHPQMGFTGEALLAIRSSVDLTLVFERQADSSGDKPLGLFTDVALLWRVCSTLQLLVQNDRLQKRQTKHK